MKAFNLLLVLSFSMIPLSAHAASVAADQILGEKYESPYVGATKADSRWSDEFNYYFQCDTSPSVEVSYDIYLPMFEFGSMKMTVPFSLEAGNYHDNKGNCEWGWSKKLDEYLRRAPNVWSTSRRGIYLDRMTADGTGMEGRAYVQGKDIAAVTGSGADHVDGFVTFQLKSCLTDRGDSVTGFSDLDAQTTDIRDMIRNLRTRGYRRFLKCDLSVDPKNYATETLTDGETISPGYTGQEVQGYSQRPGDYRLSILSSTPDLLFLTHTEGGAMADQFARQGEHRDAAREQIALKAMQDFIGFIDNDYANLLFSLNNVKISEAQRNEAIRAFFDRNGSKIKDLLGQVDDNYADVSLMNKISMMISVQDSYRTIAKVEKGITSSSPISLDQVVHQY